MQLSARGAQKTRRDSKKLMGFSKQWLPGDTLRVFYPIYRDEDGNPQISVGTVWGHPVGNMDDLGMKVVFIPTTCTIDKNGKPEGVPDIVYQFSLIAPLFIAGQKNAEMQRIMGKNYANESQRIAAISAVEQKYSKDADKRIDPVIKALSFKVCTECLSIKLKDGKGDADTVAVSSRDLGDDLIDQLYLIMEDPKYAPGPEDQFLEVEWKYPVNNDKSASGRAAKPAGLTPEYRLAAIDPEGYKAVMARSTSVCTDADSIVNRATYAVDMSKIRACLQNYAFNKSEWLDCLPEDEDDRLLRSVNVIKELDMRRALQNKRLLDAIDEALAKAHEIDPENTPAPNLDNGAPNISDIIAQNQAPATPPVPEMPAGATPVNVTAQTIPSDLLAAMADPRNVTSDVSNTSVELNLDV